MEIMNVKVALDFIQLYTLLLFVIGIAYVSHIRTKGGNDLIMSVAFSLLFAFACAPILGRIFRFL